MRTAEHRAGLEAVVLSSFTTQNPVTARETTLREAARAEAAKLLAAGEGCTGRK